MEIMPGPSMAALGAASPVPPLLTSSSVSTEHRGGDPLPRVTPQSHLPQGVGKRGAEGSRSPAALWLPSFPPGHRMAGEG